MPRSEQHCRYFTNGICSKGDSCTFVHDQSRRNENVCHFNLVGKCSFGQSCRFLHTRPRNDERPNAKNVKKGENQRVRPVQLKDPVSGLNAHAVEFVPSWKKNTAAVSSPVSYASAISGGPSTSSSAPPPFQLAQLPLCPYFEKNGECSRKDTDCQFVHGDYCDMCNGWSLHPHNEEKRKAHQTECLESHTREMERAFMMQRTDEKVCGICFENISEKGLRFGILNNCQHCYCLDCIRQWRNRHEQSDDLGVKVVRSCPECRQHSDYVIPSVIWVENGVEKDLLIDMYKENTNSKVCKYYTSTSMRTACPFGNKCFYKHQLPDGSIDPGESPHVRRRPRLNEFIFPDEEDDEDEEGGEFSMEDVMNIIREMQLSDFV